MSKQEENKHLFARWASFYDWAPFQFWMRGFQKLVLEKLQELPPQTKILDVSCGTGELLLSLWRQGKRNLNGIDFSPEMVGKAKEKLPKEILLQQAEVEHLPFPDGSFDSVVSTEAFHHYPKQKKALQEMKRVTKKGGKVMIVDINFFLHLIHWLFPKIEPGCVKVNNRKEMQRLFEEAGFQQIEQQRSFLFAVLTEGKK